MSFSGPRAVRSYIGEEFQKKGIEAGLSADYTAESLLAGEDAILSAAIAALDELASAGQSIFSIRPGLRASAFSRIVSLSLDPFRSKTPP